MHPRPGPLARRVGEQVTHLAGLVLGQLPEQVVGDLRLLLGRHRRSAGPSASSAAVRAPRTAEASIESSRAISS